MEVIGGNGGRVQLLLHYVGRVRPDRNLRGAGRCGGRPLLTAPGPDGLGADADLEGVPGSRLSRDHPFAWLRRWTDNPAPFGLRHFVLSFGRRRRLRLPRVWGAALSGLGGPR